MRLGKCFLGLGIMAFLLFSGGNAFGVTWGEPDRNCVNGTNVKALGCIGANNRQVVSPYWQVDGGSYTFIAVTHASLSGMASQIGLHINALKSDSTAYATAATFTISSGTTSRVFIVPSSHATVNATSVPTAKFIAGTSDFSYGRVRVTPVMTHPELKWARSQDPGDPGAGFRDITMLSYWGSVIIEANTTGFAMEFLGDMNDSQALPQQKGGHGFGCSIPASLTGCSVGSDYNTMSTGPNLQ